MKYSDILKNFREEKEIKQIDIAKYLNIPQALYSQYENADKIIPISHLNSLANYYNVSIDYLLGLNDNIYPDIQVDINKDIFKIRLKEFRKENKLTQAKLAKILNTTQSVISAYEKGETLILTAFLYTICKEYKVSADYLLGKTNEPKNLN